MKNRKPFIIFYLLVAYVFAQFSWWAFHIVDLNSQIYELKVEVEQLKGQDAVLFEASREKLQEKLSKRRLMVIGEGIVFMILLSMGVYITQRTFKKEVILSNQQKNFLMSITHELKSPLASIKLYLQTLQKHDLEKSKFENVLKSALNDTERLSTLVDNILMATQIDTGSFPFYMEQFDLSVLVTGISNNYKSIDQTSDDAGLAVNIETEIEPNITITADKAAISSVIANLIENAVKYSFNLPGRQAGGSGVKVELKKQDSTTILVVSDKGIGIADSAKLKIFDKFYRIENEATRKTKGTGLGLFIVKYLVEKHNGHIEVRDNEPKGSIFEVRFSV